LVIVQTVLPPFCTVTDPDGDPVVPDVTVAEILMDPSLPYAAEEGDIVSVVELVVGKTASGTVADAGVKLISPG
jgi:hypothetical protein